MDAIYVDTALLAVPNYAVDKSSADELLKRIGLISELIMPEIPLNIIVSSSAEDVLFGSNFGPDFDQISAFLDLMDIREIYSPNDLLRQYNTIFQRSLRSNDELPVEVTEVIAFDTKPELPKNLGPAFLRSETERVFATVASLQSFGSHWSVGSSINQGDEFYHLVNVSVANAVGNAVGELGDLPFSISAYVRSFTNFREFAVEETSRRIWEMASSDEELHLAISMLAISFLSDDVEFHYSRLKKFRIGTGFSRSLKDNQCFGSGKFSKITHTLCSQIVAETCTKKIGIFGKNTQQVRSNDNSKGFRVHLTKGAEALRLMFWANDEYIEFSNVGVKKELYIDVGDLNNFVRVDLDDLF